VRACVLCGFLGDPVEASNDPARITAGEEPNSGEAFNDQAVASQAINREAIDDEACNRGGCARDLRTE
jgi:hypothetical protein